MKQHILIALVSIMAFSYAAKSQATKVTEVAIGTSEFVEQPEILSSLSDENASVSVSIRGSQLYVHAINCQGQNLKVYDLVGKLKFETRIDSQDKTIRLQLSKGIYLVNVNKLTRRVSVVG